MSQTTPDGNVVLPPKKSKTGLIVGIIAAAIVVIVAAVFIFVNVSRPGATPAAGADGEPTGLGSTGQPVTIGVVGASDPYWTVYKEAAAAEGISIELVDFADYPLPNPALTEGEIDLNQFQHIVYLAQYNVASDEDLVPVGSTAIYPLGLYSDKYESVDDIPDGSTVAIPDDPSNLARALLVLQSNGLITLTGGGSIFSTVDEIDTANSRVSVTTLEAALTVTSLPDVAAAVINNDFLAPAGLASTDAIAQDDPSDPNALPYVNIFASRAEDKDNEVFAKLVEIFQNTQTVTDGLIEQSGGTAVAVTTPVSELEESLTTVEADTKANG
jgi:D-methionine transport system substrate-binding protein